MTGVEEEAIRSEIRKLVQKEDAAYQREAEKRQQNLKNYTPEGRRKDKGRSGSPEKLVILCRPASGHL